MKAIALDRFGGPDVLAVRTLPVPAVGPREVLVRVEWAGVGEWDPFEREGGYAEMLGIQVRFPYLLGSEGAGEVVTVGAEVRSCKVGDRVYAAGFLNPKGGFYAEYAAVDAELVARMPADMPSEQAAALAGVGLTALRGLDDVLHLRAGETLLVFGASGGVGHVAVQLARRMGARVFAVASGADGVALARRLGADAAVDGRTVDVVAAARAFGGVDAALLTAGGDGAERSLLAVRDGGRVAYPNGIQPEPAGRPALSLQRYNGEPDSEILGRLNRLVEAGPFEVHVGRTFALEEAARAHEAVRRHHLGKFVLRVRDPRSQTDR